MRHLLAITALLLAAQVPAQNASAKNINIMAYNVENLFDTVHDEGTIDYTYLPLAFKQSSKEVQDYCKTISVPAYKKDCLTIDWNDQVLQHKIENIASVIRSVNNGRGPDVLVLEEVENINVLNMLVEQGLSNLGYAHRVLIEGDDTRGIDVGLISKYPITSSTRHSIFVDGKKLDTRGILEVTINVDGKKLVIFGNHWPSQNNPVKDRLASAEVLNKVANSKSANAILALGDFNVIHKDNPNPFQFLTNFIDSEVEARKAGVDLMPGTHYYRGEWASLDHIFVHSSSKSAQKWNTFQIIAQDFMLEDEKGEQVPKRFDVKTGEGYADHLPVSINIDL